MDTDVIFFARVDERVRIGFTRNKKRRVAELWAKESYKISPLLYIKNGSTALKKRLHDIFKDQHIEGDWFIYDGPVKQFLESTRTFRRNNEIWADHLHKSDYWKQVSNFE